MRRKNDQTLEVGAILLMGILSLLVSIFISFDKKRPEYFQFYFLMPCSFFFFLIALGACRGFLFKKVSVTLITGTYFFKYVIIPGITCLGNYSTFLANLEVLQFVDVGIFLSVNEIIWVSISMCFAVKKSFVGLKELKQTNEILETRGDGFELLIFAFVCLSGLILIIYPELIKNFHTPFNMTVDRSNEIVLRSWRTIGSGQKEPLGIIDTFLKRIFPIVQLGLPIIGIEKIWKRWYKKNRAIGFFCSMLIIGGTMMIMTNANANTLFVCISLLFLVFYLYPSISKIAAPILMSMVCLLAFVLLLAKTSSSDAIHGNIFEKITQILNSYFGGPVNVAVAYSVHEEGGLILMIREMIGSLPFVSRISPNIFSGNITNQLFNEAFWGYLGRTDQLLPSVGQGLIYFGYLFASVVPCMLILFSIFFELRSLKSGEIKKKGVYYFFSTLCGFMIGNNISHFIGYLKVYFLIFLAIFLIRYRVRWNSSYHKR